MNNNNYNNITLLHVLRCNIFILKKIIQLVNLPQVSFDITKSFLEQKGW